MPCSLISFAVHLSLSLYVFFALILCQFPCCSSLRLTSQWSFVQDVLKPMDMIDEVAEQFARSVGTKVFEMAGRVLKEQRPLCEVLFATPMAGGEARMSLCEVGLAVSNRCPRCPVCTCQGAIVCIHAYYLLVFLLLVCKFRVVTLRSCTNEIIRTSPSLVAL
jgi:hypothetical protein